MVAKTPIRTVFNESGTATGLAEYQTGEFVPVEHGGTGVVTLTSNSILLGNGTSAIQSSPIQISGSTISASDSTIISINDGLSVTGSITSGNLLPPTDNTGVVGTNDLTWSDGRFTDLTIDDVLTVRTAIDLADGDVLRFGDNDDFKIYHDGTANRFDLITRDLTIRDDTTTRFTFGRTTGNFTTTGDITVGGNLTVNGTTTTVNSTTIEITNSFTFEGSTANDFETTLGVIDPTADRAINLPNVSGTVITSGNLSDITGLDATSIADGSVSNTEFQHLNGVTSAIQTQIDTKASTAFAIAQAVALG